MKLLTIAAITLLEISLPSSADASSAQRAYCYLPPQTVTVSGHTVATPSVSVPCP
jgi:hypothetical protein